MDFIDSGIQDYSNKFTTKTNKNLENLERETYLKTIQPRMISGFFQGRFLSILSQMIKPKNILEIGTFTGYGTLCLCEGLKKNGIIVEGTAGNTGIGLTLVGNSFGLTSVIIMPKTQSQEKKN